MEQRDFPGPATVDEEILCDLCGHTVPVVIQVGAMWVCGPCFDDIKQKWEVDQ